MVKIKQPAHYNGDGTVDVEKWLTHITEKRTPNDVRLLRHAIHLIQVTGGDHPAAIGKTCLQQGLIMAEILFELNLDVETLVAALLYSTVRFAELSLEDVGEHLGKPIANLLSGVAQMEGVSLWHKHHEIHIENMRKMLLAMVQDVRGVFVKLAERVCILRHAESLSAQEQQKVAREVMDIYAPLANRLGLGQLKWELEDLSFRYLEPDTYKKLAKLLHERRLDREQYIQGIVETLTEKLLQQELTHFQVTGRAKHIYSIYRKMKRKSVDYDKIYDVSAVRVLVDTVEQCYQVLSLVHGLWLPIPREFDDYIANPKPNGYRSLHTAVLGPQDKSLEVQIRTYQMHDVSELGVAAHWMYKEGAITRGGYEQKIAWLRQVLAWQKELIATENVSEEEQKKIFNEHVYVFTPKGDIVELPKGATPVDLAYQIHSEVGHRCRGAKVNGAMVPLTYTLNTGERVEILTSKESNPSRDWLSPHLRYITTTRARAKVHHWFKLLDFDRHAEEGTVLLEKELKRLGLQGVNLETVAHQLHFKFRQEMLAALGGGDLRLAQITQLLEKPAPVSEGLPAITHREEETASTGVYIQGVDNLLTYTAKCCKPVPGDPIVGFITKIRGVAIHRQDCPNILRMQTPGHLENEQRFIDVDWSETAKVHYPVDLYVIAHDRHGLLRDMTTTLALDKITLLGLETRLAGSLAHISLTIRVSGVPLLNRVLDKIQHLPGIVSVTRQIKG